MLEREVREIKEDDITANESSIISSRQTFLWDGNVAAMIDSDRSMDFYLQYDLGSHIRLLDEEATQLWIAFYDGFIYSINSFTIPLYIYRGLQ